MDIPLQARPKSRRMILGVSLGIAFLAGIAGLARLKPAAPTVERQGTLIDAVKRGPMVFQVRGTGTLVPLNVRFLANSLDARVERILVLPGSVVKADTPILELSNPELMQSAQDAEWQCKAAEADYQSAKARLQIQLLDLKASLASIKASNANAQFGLEANERLAREGLVSSQDLLKSRGQAEELNTRYGLERQRLQVAEDSLRAQLASQQAKVEQARALWRLKRTQMDALKVRAGMDGVLQQLPVQVGQRLMPGTTLAKVAEPTQLKAELKINETQAKDLVIGQPVSIDTRNGLVQGHVLRIDPAVQNGTVTVDASLEGPLPKGARPDLSVEGIIELDRAADAIYVGRPVQAQPQAAGTIFKLSPDGGEAQRIQVRFGRASVSTIEVIDGLQPGDQVILSDTSTWDSADRIRLK
ncbi:efflux RND transporter periplasmic adaptor subunit [Geothrix alkalitolerans]|uniref:efflux RND transporter periplasmic adaptor subunit n=1 Tax=Geothrix alkalitolerans TaxID=2922724 RepID=UPI001FAEAB29|nr:HlyD family efflux transporter periplasmic adaptor subunit [Geothrix alkalitolerans]